MVRLLLILLFWSVPASIAAADFVCPEPSQAEKDRGFWTVIGSFKKAKHALEFSGFDCIDASRCLLVGDERREIYEARLDTLHQTIVITNAIKLPRNDNFNRDKRELDLEAVAAMEAGFITVGSHAYKRNRTHTQKDLYQATRYALYHSDIEGPLSGLNTILLKHPPLDEFYRKPLDENGLNIEALGYKAGKVFVGFRAPVWTSQPLESADRFDRAYVLEVALTALLNDTSDAGRLHHIRLNHSEGIRGLDHISDGIALLTGPASPNAKTPIKIHWGKSDQEPHELDAEPPYRIVIWRPESGETQAIATLDVDAPLKPESLHLIEETPRNYTFLIIHDSGECGKPRSVVINKQN